LLYFIVTYKLYSVLLSPHGKPPPSPNKDEVKEVTLTVPGKPDISPVPAVKGKKVWHCISILTDKLQSSKKAAENGNALTFEISTTEEVKTALILPIKDIPPLPQEPVEKPPAPERSVAFETFKKTTDSYRQLTENKEQLKEKRKTLKDLGLKVNQAKKDVDHYKIALENAKQDRPPKGT
jgi:hypothetical protein